MAIATATRSKPKMAAIAAEISRLCPASKCDVAVATEAKLSAAPENAALTKPSAECAALFPAMKKKPITLHAKAR